MMEVMEDRKVGRLNLGLLSTQPLQKSGNEERRKKKYIVTGSSFPISKSYGKKRILTFCFYYLY